MEGQGSTRPERKTIEKNRRNHMKALCSKLESLLPPSSHATERTAVPLQDRIDEAVGYIKGLQERVETMKERKTRLMKIRSRPMESGELQESAGSMSPWPNLEVHDLGSGALKIVVMSAAGDQVMFYDALEVLEEKGIHIIAANFSIVDGDKAVHIIHASATGGCHPEAYELFKTIANKATHGGK